MIAAVVDPSLLRNKDPRLNIAYGILDEMAGRGNLIAEYHKHELEQLDLNMQRLLSLQQPDGTMDFQAQSGITPTSMEGQDAISYPPGSHLRMDSNDAATIDTILSEWNSEDGFSGEQLMAVADSLDFNQLDWLVSGDIEQPFSMGFE